MPVTVALPLCFDICGHDASILGEKVELSGSHIVARDALDLAAFYDASGASYIYFIQDASENDYNAYTYEAKAAAVMNTIKAGTNYTGGLTYDRTKRGDTKLDASAVFAPTVTDALSVNFFSLQDFVIGYFAYKVLGHPGAVAAISNDSVIRAKASADWAASLATLAGQDMITTAGGIPADSVVLDGSWPRPAGNGPADGVTMDVLRGIVEQVLAQDHTRFNTQQRNGLQPLIWKAGDKLQVQVRFKNNTYSLATGSLSSMMNGPVGGGVSANQTSLGVNPAKPIGEPDAYILEFTLA